MPLSFCRHCVPRLCSYVCACRRSSCAIVLTSHSMEEADLLGDDIHILAGGRLAASGTPLQLKTQVRGTARGASQR